MKEIKGTKILIVGFGKEGKSTFGYLKKNYPKLKITVVDKQIDGENYLNEIEKYDTVIKSPGVPAKDKIKKAKHLTTPTNIFFEKCPGTIIGVTGTKGKSTTSSLIAHILKQFKKDVRLVGNVGNPALDYLEKANKETFFVMELSSFQLSDIHYSPHIAVLLPIYQEHLDYHGNMRNYVKAKANITKFQIEKNYFLYYKKNKYCQQITKTTKAFKIPFEKFSKNIPLPLLGEANKINVAAAVAAASLFISKKKVLNAIYTFKPLPHRLEFAGEFQGINFVNDSLATIPEATANALSAFNNEIETLIAGGHDRGINYRILGKAIANSKVKNLILFPNTGEKIEKIIKTTKVKRKIKIFHTTKTKDAVNIAYKNTSKGKLFFYLRPHRALIYFVIMKTAAINSKSLQKKLGK